MNVLRHWLEDHWQDFETNPSLIYQLIRWINEILVPLGETMMANSLKKTMVKKLESSRNDPSSLLMFSKKAPTPLLPKTTECELLDHDPVEMARQISLKEQKLYKTISMREFLDQKWNKDHKKLSAPGIVAFIEDFNELSALVTRYFFFFFWFFGSFSYSFSFIFIYPFPSPHRSIVTQVSLRKRIKNLEKWVMVASKCREMTNFNGTMAIISGLRASSVFRLKKTWGGVEGKISGLYEQLVELMSQENNWQRYRQCLRSENPPCIPYLGVYLTDLTFLDDAHPDIWPNGGINFEKRIKLVTLIGEVAQYQQEPYCFVEVKGVQEELRKGMKGGEKFLEQDLFNLSLVVEPKGS